MHVTNLESSVWSSIRYEFVYLDHICVNSKSLSSIFLGFYSMM